MKYMDATLNYNHRLWLDEADKQNNIFNMPLKKAYEIIWALNFDIIHCFHRGDPKFQKYYLYVNALCKKKLVECTDSELKFILKIFEDKWKKYMTEKFIKEHGNDTYEFDKCNPTVIKY